MKISGRSVILLSVSLVLTLSLASLAWACTQQAQLVLLPPGPVPAGSPVTVTGEGYVPGQLVEIRWNSPDGAILATESGPSFSTTIEVPGDAAADVYYLMAVQKNVPGPFGTNYPIFGGSAPIGVSASNAEAGSQGALSAPDLGVSSDLWRGYQPGRSPVGAGHQSLGSTAESRTPALGIGLLAFGFAGIFAVSVLALVNRRRATALKNY